MSRIQLFPIRSKSSQPQEQRSLPIMYAPFSSETPATKMFPHSLQLAGSVRGVASRRLIPISCDYLPINLITNILDTAADSCANCI